MQILKDWAPALALFIGLAGVQLTLYNGLRADLGGRIDRLDVRIDRLDTRIDRLDTRIDRLDVRLDILTKGLADVRERLARVETRLALPAATDTRVAANTDG